MSQRAPPFPSLVHWGHCCVPCIYPFFTSYQEKLGLFLHSGKERVHLQNICSMIKIASNNKERWMQADMFPEQASFGVPFVRSHTDCVPEHKPPVETAQVLPQASLSQSQATACVQESCISALCLSLGLASCPGFRAKEAALSGHPSQSSGWAAVRGGTEE